MAITDGIVGCWSPSVRGSGYLLPDLTRGGNHCASTQNATNTTWTTTGGFRGLLLQAGSVSTAPRPLAQFGAGNFTIATWCLISSTQTAPDNLIPLLSSKAQAAAAAGIAVVYFYAGANAGKFLMSTGSGSTSSEPLTSSAVSGIAGRYAHIVMRRDSGATDNGDFVIDGVQYGLASSLTVLNVNTTSPLNFARDAGGFRVANCTYGETAAWNRALPLSECRELYRRGNGAIARELTGQTRRRVYGFAPSTGARRRRILCGDYS